MFGVVKKILGLGNEAQLKPLNKKADAIEKASTYVPVAPTGAEFIQKVKLVSAEVDGLMPILPLAKIKADPMSIDMTLGDTKYTQDFSLSGYDDVSAHSYSRKPRINVNYLNKYTFLIIAQIGKTDIIMHNKLYSKKS